MNTLKDILNWIDYENKNTNVVIKKIAFSDCRGWVYDNNIHRADDSFFRIVGIKNSNVTQPIILQNEIGFLGLLAKLVDDELFFFMQAKIEPGNINCVQLSPTVQATKSNFTQKHGGKRPPYIDLFLNPSKVIVDQLQSE